MSSRSVLSLRFPVRYAKALYGTAHKANCVAAVVRDLDALRHALEADRRIVEWLKYPLLNADTRVAVAALIAKQLGGHDVTRKFLLTVAAMGRLAYLPEILAAWRATVHEHENILDATLRTATPLSEAEQKKLKDSLEKQLKKTLDIQVEQDDSLLGGFVLQVGSMRFDASLRNRLKRLESHISHVNT
ncbi:MAG: ATP synthase F1 subunit delta [Alphaproteobacteria bacterium GM202ARS2]|nr:ATP synthase F1 subunit delta [Alphaproteobacteria bacterium GM202ARS2]